MDFPEYITIKIIDETTDEPIYGIALQLILFANRKNNYEMIPKISNSSGVISIKRSWVESEIEECCNMFIMDYSSRLDDCKPMFEVSVLSGEDIIKINEARKRLGICPPIMDTKNQVYTTVKHIEYLPDDADAVLVTLRLKKIL